MHCKTFLLTFLTILLFALPALSQPQAGPARPQTARQALIEIVTRGGDALTKHLTVEVQDVLKANSKSSAELGVPSGIIPVSHLQSFDAGDVLFVYKVPGQHERYEVRVDSDDLAGDEDSLDLSLHLFRDDEEQDTEWKLLSSHFTVSMKMQQNIWRLNKIAIGAEFPVGDPKFIENAILNKGSFGASRVNAASEGVSQAGSGAASVLPAAMPPERVVSMLALAEGLYARQHPDLGFTCSFAELAVFSKMMGIDQHVITGTYNEYRFALSGCQGKPAGSFQITAEPVTAGNGAKAFCTDATQNLRASEDGQGTSCLLSGRAQRSPNSDQGGITGIAIAIPKK